VIYQIKKEEKMKEKQIPELISRLNWESNNRKFEILL